MRHCESLKELKELKGFRGCRREETENVEALTEERRVRERGACSPTREQPIRLWLGAGCVLPGLGTAVGDRGYRRGHDPPSVVVATFGVAGAACPSTKMRR